MNKLNKAQKESVKSFASVTESTEKQALEVLKAADWNNEVAFELYYAQTSRSQPAAAARTGRGPKLDNAAVEAAFRKYKDAGGEQILAAGVMQLCEDMGVSPSDVSLLVLAWHFQARRMCEFSRAEWTAGMASLGCDSVAKLGAKLPALRASLSVDTTFRAVYAFAFAFALEEGAKALMADTALALWLLLLPGQWALGQAWCDFIADQKHLKVVSKDTWAQLLQFSRTVKADLSNYDPEGAWPSIIDDFAEQLAAKAAQETAT